MANAGQAKFDPRASERKGITPGFSNQNGKSDRTPITGSEKDSTNKPNSEKGDAGKDKDEAAKNAEQNLADAEQNAANSPVNEGEDLDDINDMEGGEGFNPVKSFVDKASSKTLVGRFAFNKLNNKGPVGTILLLLVIVGTMMFSAQSLMPFSLLEQLRDKFDGINISNQTRSKVFLRTQLKRKGIKGATTKKVFGNDVYKLSKNQQTKLAAEGIELKDFEIDEGGGKKKTISALVFDDGSGTRKLVTADYDDITSLKKLGSGVMDAVDIEGGKYKIDFDDIQTFDTKWRTDTDFMNGYNKSSRTWRGSVGAWFDARTASFLNRFALTRKIFGNFIERVQGEQAGNTRSRVSDTINGSGVQETGRTFDELEYNAKEAENVDDGVDENGNKKSKRVETDYGDRRMSEIEGTTKEKLNEGGSGKNKKINKNNVNAKAHGNTDADINTLKNKLENSISNKVSGVASMIANTSCMILEVVGSALLMSTAQEAVQLLKVGTSFLESVDKTRAGDGEGAPINTLANALMIKGDTVVDDGNNSSKVVRKDMNAMQSNGIMSLYTKTPMNPYDESVKTFTYGETVNNILGKFTVSLEAFRGCRTAKMSAAIVGATFDIASIVVGVFTGGVGTLLAQLGKQAAVSFGIGVAVTTLTSTVVSFLVPKIASWFIRDLVTDLAGENYGNAIVAGAERYMTNNFRFGGGSLASEGKYIAFRTQQEKILAEQAEYERKTMSPFDPTSQNTFLGSIVKQIITLGTLSNGPTNILSGISSMVGGSILALMPSASAAGEIASDLISSEDFEKTCPYLAQIGAYGDAFCNPYIITDMDTIGTDPGDIEENGYIQNSLDSSGQIKEDTNLAKYIIYCGNRTSEFGITDNNIMNEIGSSAFLNTGNNMADTAIGALPAIGDLADFFSNKDQLAQTGWITGQNCVAGNNETDNEVGIVSWDENKVYQRYVEDQRLYESLEPGYNSPVTAFLDKYYEEHPLDNSYEGILARFSGLTKDQVVATLDYIDYLKYIAEYDPSERYAFGEEFVRMIKDINLHAEGDNSFSLLQHNIVYADVRNRAFAMA